MKNNTFIEITSLLCIERQIWSRIIIAPFSRGHIEEGVFIVQLSINLRLVCHNTSNKKISGVWSSAHIGHGTHWNGILRAGKLQTSEECREYLDLLDQEKFQNDKLINNILIISVHHRRKLCTCEQFLKSI